MVWQAAARANRLAVRHPFLPLCLSAGRQARGQAGRQAGGQGCQPDGRKACRPFRLQRKGTFAKVVSLRRCVAAFGSDVAACGVVRPPLPPLSLSLPPFAHLLIPTVPLRSCLYAPCRQAGTRAGRDAGGRARMPARRQEGVPAIPTAKERDFRRTYVPLPLRGSIWRRCGSLWRSSAPFRPGFTPYLCTQAAGQCSRRVPQAPAPSFFWAAGGYRATDTQSSRE